MLTPLPVQTSALLLQMFTSQCR